MTLINRLSHSPMPRVQHEPRLNDISAFVSSSDPGRPRRRQKAGILDRRIQTSSVGKNEIQPIAAGFPDPVRE
jgi:hypothetical protein